MELNVRLLFLLLPGLLVSACTPAPLAYHDRVQPIPITVGKTATSRVSAAVEAWRNSGVQVQAGEHYRISATGRWKTYGSCNFTGADGVGLYNAVCSKSPLFPAIMGGYSHSALIAKISMQGTPFAVGAQLEFEADKDGVLFLRINDCVNCNFDNEGFVDVSIQPVQAVNPSEAPQPATQAIRTALVIGNSAYQQGPLKNPVNDARAMAKSLKKLGFDVTLALNANQAQMETAIDTWGRTLVSGKQIALFYYAGHGVQVNGDNYLIPTDAAIKRQSDVRYKAVNIGQVLATMGEADNLNIVILDACRDNPLPRSVRSAARGLVRMEGPKGTIIGFATSPGSVASDGEGDNGVYTRHFLEQMQKPGLSIEQVFKQVLQGVHTETGGQQTPWTESSFTGDFAFRPD